MNEPALRTEEQIISLFKDKETLVCQGWILKKMEGRYSGKGRTAGTIWEGRLSESLSVPLLSKGGEILQRTGGLENGFTE